MCGGGSDRANVLLSCARRSFLSQLSAPTRHITFCIAFWATTNAAPGLPNRKNPVLSVRINAPVPCVLATFMVTILSSTVSTVPLNRSNSASIVTSVPTSGAVLSNQVSLFYHMKSHHNPIDKEPGTRGSIITMTGPSLCDSVARKPCSEQAIIRVYRLRGLGWLAKRMVGQEDGDTRTTPTATHIMARNKHNGSPAASRQRKPYERCRQRKPCSEHVKTRMYYLRASLPLT